jgi:signal transduction histidine kinase
MPVIPSGRKMNEEPKPEFLPISSELKPTDLDDVHHELDLSGIIKFLQMLSREMNLVNLVEKMMEIVIENAGAERGYLLQYDGDKLLVQAKGSLKSGIRVLQSKQLASNNKLSLSIVKFVIHKNEPLIVNNAASDERFKSDPYFEREKPRSILCHPVFVKGKLTSIIYLENNSELSAFTPEKLKILNLLSTQITISLENALLYQNLEEKVVTRTREVVSQKELIEHAYTELRAAQSQMVHSEKMASLGQLTAGIAHEINNPINFISIGIKGLEKNFKSFMKVIDMYESINATGNVEQKLKDIEALKQKIRYPEVKGFIIGLLDDIKLGADRTAEIIQGLRSFSRLNEAEYKAADIHEGLDATLVLLRTKTKNTIDVVKEYDPYLPVINCNPGQLNQVFMNILTNAIEAIEMKPRGGPNEIRIKTANAQDKVIVQIKDSGVGIPKGIVEKIFDPFFTTKEVGKGTGLGLSISFGIIKKHNGHIEVSSDEKGTEFTITIPKEL